MEKIKNQNIKYLACEKKFTFFTLIFVAGIYGAYTFNMRGNIFCNAQTANMVLLGIGIGTFDIQKIIHYAIPLISFIVGSFVSDFLGRKVKKTKKIRWDTAFIGIEIVTMLVVGFLDKSVPDQVVQVIVCSICAMQFYTFRSCEGLAMATIFSTNNLRMFITNIIKYKRKNDEDAKEKAFKFGIMLLLFIVGAIVSTVATNYLSYYGIWISLPPLIVLFAYLLMNDTKYEKSMFDIVPLGH